MQYALSGRYLHLGIVFALCYYVPYFYLAAFATEIFCVIRIIASDDNPDYKVPWLLFVLIIPVAGFMLYFLFYSRRLQNRFVKRLNNLKSHTYHQEDGELLAQLKKENPVVAAQANMLCKIADTHLFTNTKQEYFPLGEEMHKRMLTDLEAAQNFIYMEYFIVEEGKFWNSILEVLERKAKEGLDVRLIYDDYGCVALLPRKYHVLLNKKGIKTKKYAALTPFLSTHLNNRDHRKMIIVDGKVAMSGGVNLCDEYINVYEKYGHWKDNGFIIRGDAVYNYVLMFLQMWHTMAGRAEEDYKKYLERKSESRIGIEEKQKTEEAVSETTYPGYVIPYGDGPHQEENVAEQVYMDIINRATKYVYIMTPYLILDHEMKQSLMHASRSGVDVRIIMPHIPDKKAVFAVARTYYPQLIKSGVKIYEYTPGFVHAKTFLADDEVAVVGTINLDFRSMYLHYECGSLFYRTESMMDIKADFTDMFEKCQQITMKDYYKFPLRHKLTGRILRIIGPLI